MTAIQLGAAFAVGFLVPVVLFQGSLQAFGLGLISGFVIALAAGGPPLVGALIAQRIASSRDRTRGADLLAVVIGALAGAALTGIVFGVVFGFGGDTPWWLSIIAGLASAAGFALQVHLAWRADSAAPADPVS